MQRSRPHKTVWTATSPKRELGQKRREKAAVQIASFSNVIQVAACGDKSHLTGVLAKRGFLLPG
jgi:hypothetical protein